MENQHSSTNSTFVVEVNIENENKESKSNINKNEIILKNEKKQDKLEKIFTKRIYIYIIAIFCMALWGSAFPSIKLGYEEFHIDSNDLKSIILFAGIRFTFAGFIIIVFYSIFKRKIILPEKKFIKITIILALLGCTIQYLIFYIGLSNSTGVKCSVLNSCNTFFTVLLAHIVLKNDKINIRKAIGIIIGMAGVIVINLGLDFIFGKDDNNEKFEWSFTFIGEGFIMISCFLSSLSSIIIKKLLSGSSESKTDNKSKTVINEGDDDEKIKENEIKLSETIKVDINNIDDMDNNKDDEKSNANHCNSNEKIEELNKEAKEKKIPNIIVITGYQMFLGGLVLDIISLIWMIFSSPKQLKDSEYLPYRNVGIYGYLLMTHMCLLSSIAFSLWNTLLKYNPAGKMAYFNFLIPIFGSILSGIFLGEDLFKIENLVALILVCIGVLIVC